MQLPCSYYHTQLLVGNKSTCIKSIEVIYLQQGADLHMAQLMPLPLTVSCFSKIQIGFTFLVPAHSGSPGKRAIKQVVCVNNGQCMGAKISDVENR